MMSLLRHAEQTPDAIALSTEHKDLTYSALIHRMKTIAEGLKPYIHTRDKIAILSSNRIEFIEVFLGAVFAGAIPVPLDPKWSPTELDMVLKQCQPAVIFAEDEHASDITKLDLDIQLFTFNDASTHAYEKWLSTLTPAMDTDRLNDLLFIGFTSGTTGIPKGFMRSHTSWIHSFEATIEAFQLHSMEHFIAPGPLVHSLSLFALMQSLYLGATFHLMQHFDASIVVEKCTTFPEMIMYVVPTMIESILQQPIPEQMRIQALISSGGTWSEASKKRCKEVFANTKLYEYYGSSEASYISFMDVYTENKQGSVGIPFQGVEVSIRDDDFKEVPTGTIGQLYIRSHMVFSGYYPDSVETASVFREGYLTLGDYVSVDHDGYLYIAGRVKNRMISGGLNIFPEEIETVLLKRPEIQEVMVLGVPDPYWGEQVTVLVKWKGQDRLSLEDIKLYCRQYLASYKAPKQLFTIEQFIYTSSGKLARQMMKDMVQRRSL
ncbi:AMP-binding protein [Paenibacillus shirakamiensis]|nr:AMP-binding protein [Paenibacillus shirakamiensis]